MPRMNSGRFFGPPAFLIFLLPVFVTLAGCGFGEKAAEIPGLSPADGVVLDTVSAAAFSPGGAYLAMGSAEGIRLWETARGRQICFFPRENEREVLGLVFGSDMKSLRVRSAENEYSLALPSLPAVRDTAPAGGVSGSAPGEGVLAGYRGGAYSLRSGSGASLVLFDDFSGRELFRYYCFSGTGGAWLCREKNGYYNASPGGGDFLLLDMRGRQQRLSAFAGLLFRPDLCAQNSAGEELPASVQRSLAGRLRDLEPPRLSLDGEVSVSGGKEIAVRFTLSEARGGTGRAVLYRRDAKGRELPERVFRPFPPEEETPSPEEALPREEALPPEEGGSKTAAKKRGGFTVKVPLEAGTNHIGVSVFNRDETIESERVWISYNAPLFVPAAGTAAVPDPKPVLYAVFESAVPLEDGDYSDREALEAFLARQASGDLYSAVRLCADIEELRPLPISPDDVVLFFLSFPQTTGETGDFLFKNGKTQFDFLEALPRISSARNIFFLNFDELDETKRAAAERFCQWFKTSSVAAPAGEAEVLSRINASGGPYLGAAELVGGPPLASQALLEPQAKLEGDASLAFPFQRFPSDDFPVIDRFAEPERPSIRTSLTVSSVSGLSRLGSLSRSGVNFSELNPVNYTNFDTKTMSAMGMEQFMIAYLQGQRYYKDGEYEKAAEEYSRSIKLNGNFSRVYAARGNVYNRRGDFARAIEDYNRALRIESTYAEAYNYRGYARAALGDLSRAVEDYTLAIRYRADYADAYFNRASAYEENKEYDKAAGDYGRVIELEPKNAAAYNRRGCVFYNNFNDDRAIGDFTEALRLVSTNALYYYNRGNAWYSKGDYDKALADLNQALKLNPDLKSAYKSRAAVWRKKGDELAAERDFAAAQ